MQSVKLIVGTAVLALGVSGRSGCSSVAVPGPGGAPVANCKFNMQ